MLFLFPKFTSYDCADRERTNAETLCEFSGIPAVTGLEKTTNKPCGFQCQSGLMIVSTLCGRQSPANVAGFVTKVVINSINRMFRRRWPDGSQDIGDERDRRVAPTLAYADTASAVVFIGVASRVVASLFHAHPSRIKRMVGAFTFTNIDPGAFHARAIGEPAQSVAQFAGSAVIEECGISHWRAYLTSVVLKAGGVSALSA